MFSIPFSYATPCSQMFCYINYIGLFQPSVFFKNGELQIVKRNLFYKTVLIESDL